MAEETVEIDVKINAEGSIAQLKELKKQMKDLPVGSSEWTTIAKKAREIQDNLEDAKVTTIDFADQLKAAPGPLGALGKGIDSVKIATQSFGTALKATGIGLVVAAIGGLVAAFSQSESAMKKLEPIMNAFQKILGGILKALEPLIDAFLDLAMKALPYVTKGIGIFYSGLVGLFTFIKQAGGGIIDILKGIFNMDLDAIKAGTNAIKNSFSDAVKAGEEAYARFEEGTKEQTKIEKENEEERLKNAADARKKREEAEREARERRIANLDAEIQNEIDKEKTSAEKLRKLLDDRLKEDLKQTGLSEAQKLAIKRKYDKMYEDALKEDDDRRKERAQKEFEDFEKIIGADLRARKRILDDDRRLDLNSLEESLSKKEITEREYRISRTKVLLTALIGEKNAMTEFYIGQELMLDNQLKKGILKQEEYDKKKLDLTEAYNDKKYALDGQINDLVVKRTVDANKDVIDDTKKANEDLIKAYEERVSMIDVSYSSYKNVRERVSNEILSLNDLLAKDAIKQEEYTKRRIDLENLLLESKLRNIDTAFMLADATGQLAQAFSEETDTANALLKVQEALNLAGQIANFVTQIQVLAKKADAQASSQAALAKTSETIATSGNTIATAGNTAATAGNAVVTTVAAGANTAKGAAKLPFPASLIAVISVIAAFVGIIASIKSLLSKGKEAEKEFGGAKEAGAGSSTKAVGTTFAKGGLLDGPSHAQGGIKTSFGELEGGEYVINRRSTASFLPLLTAINSVGNRKYQDGGMMTNMDTIQAMMATQPSPIVKTYVVASDMTSQQEADKRLMDLAKI